MSEMIHKSAIRTVAAYETVDGQKFHSATEAQEHTRFFLIDSIISSAVKGDPQFARLDPDLLRNFCRKYGAHLGNVMGEPFKPLPMAPATGGVVANVTVTNTTRPGEEPRHGDRVEVRGPLAALHRGVAASGEKRWDTHPLDPLKGAMAAVEAKEAASLSDDEIAAELDRVMREGSQQIDRKAV